MLLQDLTIMSVLFHKQIISIYVLLVGGVLLLWCEHLQGQVLVEACQEEQGGFRLPQAHLFIQEAQTSHKRLETGNFSFILFYFLVLSLLVNP